MQSSFIGRFNSISNAEIKTDLGISNAISAQILLQLSCIWQSFTIVGKFWIAIAIAKFLAVRWIFMVLLTLVNQSPFLWSSRSRWRRPTVTASRRRPCPRGRPGCRAGQSPAASRSWARGGRLPQRCWEGGDSIEKHFAWGLARKTDWDSVLILRHV